MLSDAWKVKNKDFDFEAKFHFFRNFWVRRNFYGPKISQNSKKCICYMARAFWLKNNQKYAVKSIFCDFFCFVEYSTGQEISKI